MRCNRVGLLCVQNHATDRPTMPDPTTLSIVLGRRLCSPISAGDSVYCSQLATPSIVLSQ
ncbi:hypothetical protein TorRG33x02_159980 [Trema orientale]|uniref:Protein kinase-like domain containing protein n=1 Tax=Trema orientale TaxID=63057 RepID=A0A2P5ERI9_TREOI|nr:hypothetical protein TorRG33x02_159980 [Trema orientale]